MHIHVFGPVQCNLGKLAITDSAASSSSGTITIVTPLMVEIKQQGAVLETGKKQMAKCLGDLKLLSCRIDATNTTALEEKQQFKTKCKQALDSLTEHEDHINMLLAKIFSVEDANDDAKKLVKDELTMAIKDTSNFVDAAKLQISNIKLYLKAATD